VLEGAHTVFASITTTAFTIAVFTITFGVIARHKVNINTLTKITITIFVA